MSYDEGSLPKGFVRWASDADKEWIEDRSHRENVPEWYRVAVVDDLVSNSMYWTRWELDARARPCRWTQKRVQCRRPSVAILYRGGINRRPYGYCEQHLYGRKLEDGRLLNTILVGNSGDSHAW